MRVCVKKEEFFFERAWQCVCGLARYPFICVDAAADAISEVLLSLFKKIKLSKAMKLFFDT